MKFVIIDSKIDITLTNGLHNADKTNYNSRVGNNLNIAPLWTKTAVEIKRGKHLYPSEIADWPAFKVLEKSDVFTLGRETDEGSEEDEAMLKAFMASKEEVDTLAEMSEIVETKRRRKSTEDAAK